MTALALFSPSRAARVSASAFAVSSAIAACAASEQSRATSSGEKARGVRSAANSTPITRPPSSSGTPMMATRPSSSTPASICPVWWKRSSVR